MTTFIATMYGQSKVESDPIKKAEPKVDVNQTLAQLSIALAAQQQVIDQQSRELKRISTRLDHAMRSLKTSGSDIRSIFSELDGKVSRRD